ncbi:CO4B-like protein, partial [Mya arenaria]
IFQALDSHDLGCGAGSGQTSEEIFKNAGLTILTNANADNAALTRNSDHCDKAKLRDRRSVSKLMLAERLLEWKENKLEYMNIEVDLNPRDDCMTKAMAIRRETYITHSCISSMYRFCLERLTTELTDKTAKKIMQIDPVNATIDKKNNKRTKLYLIRGKGRERRSIFPDDEQYRKDLNMLLELGHSLRVRSNFEASFFFEEHQLQDSITEWSIQAIGLSATEGACIAESVDVKTYQPFFIQLDLPYKATRFERFIIKATVFNNYDQTQSASVYLKAADGLCYGTSPGQNSPRTLVELEPNSAKTVSFSAIPLNEGIMETIQIHACLDPNNQMEACMNSPQVTADDPLHSNDRPVRTYKLHLTLPTKALIGTGTATAYIETDVMNTLKATLLDGVDKMFRLPKYNGENTMIYTAPIVYGMNYLRKTGLQTTANAEQGTTCFERSFGIPEDRRILRSMDILSNKLTAFVAKVFCQAERVVDGFVVKESLQRTLEYIANKQKGTGYFVDDKPVLYTHMQGVLGQGDRKEDPSLTSFVLIALQECPERTE